MSHAITLSDEEIEELEDVLNREVAASRIEIRRTDDREFRSQVQRRMELAEHVLAAVRHARSQSQPNPT